MTLSHRAFAFLLLALSGLASAQSPVEPAVGAAAAQTEAAAASEAAPASRGGPADWLGEVQCVSNGLSFRCFSDPNTEILSCRSKRYPFFKAENGYSRPRPFGGLAHPCTEQGEQTTCVYRSKDGWSCGRAAKGSLTVTEPSRRCHFVSNRGDFGVFDCRHYDMATGAKAHLTRCVVGARGGNGARMMTCRPVETSYADWL